jgi:predicted Fe-Mo cluster-binding NifX family protein
MTAVKVAFPVNEGRVAPLLDTAEDYILADTGEGRVLKTETVCFPGVSPEGILLRLKEAGAGVLICGAVSRCLQREVVRQGISLVPFVSGTPDEILNGWLDGTIINDRFALPGCRRNGNHATSCCGRNGAGHGYKGGRR